MRSSAELRRDARMWLSRATGRSLAPPDWLSINLTLRCNLSCVMCTTCYDAPELSRAEILDLIDQAAAWGIKVLNPLGGEPFVRSDLEDILAHAARRDLYVTLTTNATLVNPTRAARIAAIPAEKLHVNVSLDGLEDAHDRVRGRGSFRRAIAGYRNLREADARVGNPRRKICANTLLHRGNLDTFPAWLDFLDAEGFDGIQILNLFRDDEDADVGGMWFRPEDLPRLEALVETLVGRPRILNRPEDLRLIVRYYRDGLRPLEAPCWAGWKELYVNADGTTIMCDGNLDFLAGAFGSVRRNTLREIWGSEALRERRAVVKQCSTPCIQNCYLRRESDSARAIAGGLVRNAVAPVTAAVSARLPARDVDGVLTLELSDTPDLPGDPRLERLFARSPVSIAECHADPARLAELRDRGYLDFGRGFMGIDVVRHVLDELARARLRFRAIHLGWRGEPLLHPQFADIDALLDEARREGRVGVVRLLTSGRLLREPPRAEVWTDPARGGSGGRGAPPSAALNPVISWDARVTVSPDDVTLARKVGDVLHEPFAAIWPRILADQARTTPSASSSR